MGKWRYCRSVELSADELVVLRALAVDAGVDAQVAVRARIVLAAGRGSRRVEIAREVGVSLPTVDRWLARYGEAGVAGLAGGVRGRPRREGGEVKPLRAGDTDGMHSDTVGRGRSAGVGDLHRVPDRDGAIGGERLWEEAERVLPLPAEGVRKGSGAEPRSVVHRLVVVEPGPEAELLRREQTKATLNLLRWMADNPESPTKD